jgi:hypothetical protein
MLYICLTDKTVQNKQVDRTKNTCHEIQSSQKNPAQPIRSNPDALPDFYIHIAGKQNGTFIDVVWRSQP